MPDKIIFDYILGSLRTDGGLTARITGVENATYYIEIFEEVTSTTGTLTLPAGATVVLDQYSEDIDALCRVITSTGQKPVERFATDASGNIITVALSGAGNTTYTLSGTPTGSQYAVCFVISISEINLRGVGKGIILQTEEVEAYPLGVAQGGTGQATAQAAINTLTAVSGATNEHVLTKDTTTGNAIYKAPAPGWPSLTSGYIPYDNAGAGADSPLATDGTNIGLGTTTPRCPIHINVGDYLGGSPQPPGTALYSVATNFVASAYNNSANFDLTVAENLSQPGFRGVFRGVRARGTLASPTNADNGDFVLSLLAGVYDTGGVVRNTGDFSFTVDGAVGSGNGNVPVKATLRLRDSTGAWQERLTVKRDGKVGACEPAPESPLHVTQSDASGALQVATLTQVDVDEPFIKFIGTAASADLTRSIVDVGDVSTATVAGYVKIEVKDDGNQITDQDYFIPVYTLA